MSIFTKRAQPAKIMLDEASPYIFHTSGWTMLKYISIQNLNQICHASRVMSIFTKRARPAKTMLGEASSHFFIPVQWMDNVKIHKYTKFEPIIPRESRVMSIFTN